MDLAVTVAVTKAANAEYVFGFVDINTLKTKNSFESDSEEFLYYSYLNASTGFNLLALYAG